MTKDIPIEIRAFILSPLDLVANMCVHLFDPPPHSYVISILSYYLLLS